MLPSVLPRLATDSAVRVFPGFGNFSLFKTPFPGRDSLPRTELPPYLFCLFFSVFYIFSYLFLKTMICFSGCLMSSASIQKFFCEVYSALKCSFDEFVREKVVSPSYSSTILGPPPLKFAHSLSLDQTPSVLFPSLSSNGSSSAVSLVCILKQRLFKGGPQTSSNSPFRGVVRKVSFWAL